MTSSELDHLRGWIGRVERGEGIVTAELVARLNATIHQLELCDDVVPLGIHWCLALDTVPGHQLGIDGHALKGGFLPPVPLLNRMWASGALDFHHAFIVGDVIRRQSSIADIAFKQGRTGPLCFVAVDHQWCTERGVALTERQNIVYRDGRAGGTSVDADVTSAVAPPLPRAEELVVMPDAPMAFRYSALTFNAHRIHYDRDYAAIEGYPERIVQGPLQATLLMNLAAKRRGALKRFVFRALRPAFVNNMLRLSLVDSDGGGQLETNDGAGEVCMSAQAST